MTDRHEEMQQAARGALRTLQNGLVQLLEAVQASDALLGTVGIHPGHPVRVANRAALALDNRAPDHATTARHDTPTDPTQGT